MSSELDVAESDEAVAGPSASRDRRNAAETTSSSETTESSEKPAWPRGGGRITAAVRWFTRRDILGVNAGVLLILMVPLAFGYYAKLHWVGYFYPPDSRYYVMMTLRDMGYSDVDAITKQYTVAQNIAESWFFAHNDPTWLTVQSRMLYPMLCIPFVWVFGLFDGMVILPMLCLAVALFAVARIAQRLYGPFAALAAGGIMASCTFMNDLAEALTDPVTIGIVGLILLNLPIGRRARGHNLVFLGLLSVMMCLTRPVMPMPAGLVFCGWLWATVFPGDGRPRRARNEWTLPAAIVVSATVLTHLVIGHFEHSGAGSQISQATSDLPKVAYHLTWADTIQTVQNDKFLTVLLLGAMLFVVLRFKDIVAGAFFGALAGTYLIIIAGVNPSEMRYESVLFPVAALAFAALVHHLAPPALRGGSVGDGELPTTGLPSIATWWQRRPYRVPTLGGAGALALAGIIAWSATHGSTSMVASAPPSPADAAAVAGTAAARKPVGHDPAENTLSGALNEAMTAYTAKDPSQGDLAAYVDWRHAMRYRPMHPGDPGWDQREADGTVVLRWADLDNDRAALLFSGALTLNGAVNPDTVTVVTRTKGVYGEDVTFTVEADGKIKHGHATTLYPFRVGSPGLVTQFVYDD